LLIFLQFPWRIVFGFGFYFSAPVSLQYFVYDSIIGRMLLFLTMAAPSLGSAFFAFHSLSSHHRPQLSVYRILLALLCLVASLFYTGWIFWMAAINPANPRDPAYWL